jgi:hypothetical protein
VSVIHLIDIIAAERDSIMHDCSDKGFCLCAARSAYITKLMGIGAAGSPCRLGLELEVVPRD